jgi:hypothetical protein
MLQLGHGTSWVEPAFQYRCNDGDRVMVRAGILWLLGVPISIIILLALFTNII